MTLRSSGECADPGAVLHDRLRRCQMCGVSIDYLRSDAETCGPACRRERNRVRRLLAGEADGPYRNLQQWLDRRRRRARQAGGVL